MSDAFSLNNLLTAFWSGFLLCQFLLSTLWMRQNGVAVSVGATSSDTHALHASNE